MTLVCVSRLRDRFVRGCDVARQVSLRRRYFLPALLILVLGQIVTSGWLTDVAAQAPAARSAVPSAALRDKVQARLNQLHDADGFPGATASVILPDSSEILAATGVSNLETKSAMRPGDRMLAGSIGKTFFVVIFLRMVGDHQMELDQKISTCFARRNGFIACRTRTTSRFGCC